MANLYFLLVIAVAVLGVSSNKKVENELEKYIEICRVEMELTPEEIKILVEKANADTYEQDAGCLINCIGVRSGVMDYNGKLLPDKLTEAAILVGGLKEENASKVAELIQDCAKIRGDTGCANAFKVQRCLNEKLGGSS